MNFKEHITKDITNCIINDDEFAEVIAINGATVKVVEDSDKLMYRIVQNYNGLVIGDMLFYISAEEYAKIPNVLPTPSVNQAINYKGKPAIITNLNKEMGVYEIVIQYTGGGF